MSTNIYAQFAKLFKRDMIIATVVSVNATNKTSTVQDFNGLTFVVLGTSVAAPNRAFIKDGIIQGQAPALTTTFVLV